MGSSCTRNSTRLAQRRAALPELPAIRGRLVRTRAFSIVARRSLEADDRGRCSQEAEVLDEALAALNAVYNEPDGVDVTLRAAFKRLGVADLQPRRARSNRDR